MTRNFLNKKIFCVKKYVKFSKNPINNFEESFDDFTSGLLSVPLNNYNKNRGFKIYYIALIMSN